MRATDILRQLAHTEGFDPRVVSKCTLRQRMAKLSSEERRGYLAELRRTGKLVAPGIFAFADPLAAAVYQGWVPSPRPVDVAAALEQQEGWIVGMPRDVALYMMGMGERPLAPAVLPYDQPIRREYPCGLVLEPADPALLRRNPIAQAVLLALAGQDLSEDGIRRMVSVAAAGAIISASSMRLELAECLIRGELYGAAEVFAQALVAVGQTGYSTRAPADWTPPADADRQVVVDGWRVEEFGEGDDVFHALTGASVRNHPYIGQGECFTRSSPILWIDRKLGWAKTQSRLYRLGLTHAQWQAERKRQAAEAEARWQRTVEAIQEIRAAAEGLAVTAEDWDSLELTGGAFVLPSAELRETLVIVLERGGLSEAATAVANEMLERLGSSLDSGMDADF